MAENPEKQLFTFFAFLPPYIGVSGSVVPRPGRMCYRLNTKTVEYQAARREIKNFWYQSIDLIEIYRLKDTREPETPI